LREFGLVRPGEISEDCRSEKNDLIDLRILQLMVFLVDNGLDVQEVIKGNFPIRGIFRKDGVGQIEEAGKTAG